eukprot:16438684-Heterocapsa_arctica.AAC.1
MTLKSPAAAAAGEAVLEEIANRSPSWKPLRSGPVLDGHADGRRHVQAAVCRLRVQRLEAEVAPSLKPRSHCRRPCASSAASGLRSRVREGQHLEAKVLPGSRRARAGPGRTCRWTPPWPGGRSQAPSSAA